MTSFLSNIRAGFTPPSPEDLLDFLQPTFPWLEQLGETPQDPEWHAEGNVKTHTLMVIDETYRLLETNDFPPEERVILCLAAALHDIGKTVRTREEVIDGKIRIVSPRHAVTGRHYIAPRLASLPVSPSEFHQILGLVGHHHDVLTLLHRKRTKNAFYRLSRAVSLPLLKALEEADIRGRICQDREEKLELLDLFQMEAQSFGTWENADCYSEWQSIIETETQSPRQMNFVLNEAKIDFELNKIYSPEEAIARCYQTSKSHSHVTLTCGPSGSGKST
ncbi:MAG: HD domain-containing protein, partial [Verrucomicrobiota bacterium]